MGGLIELTILGGIVAVVVVVLTRINGNRGSGDPDDGVLMSDLGQRSWSSDDGPRNDLSAMAYGDSSDDPSRMDSDRDGIADSMDTSDDSSSDSSDSSDSGSSDD